MNRRLAPPLMFLAASTVALWMGLFSSATALPQESLRIQAESATPVAGGAYRVTADYLNLRAEADGSSAIVGALARGDRVTVLDDSGQGWWHVRTVQCQDGWVAARYLEETPSTPGPTQCDPDAQPADLPTSTAASVGEPRATQPPPAPTHAQTSLPLSWDLEDPRLPVISDLWAEVQARWPQVPDVLLGYGVVAFLLTLFRVWRGPRTGCVLSLLWWLIVALPMVWVAMWTVTFSLGPLVASLNLPWLEIPLTVVGFIAAVAGAWAAFAE